MKSACPRAREIFDLSYHKIVMKTDQMFLRLFIVQWVLCVAISIWISPLTWTLDQAAVNPHIYFAIGLGGLLTLFPAFLIWREPGAPTNRYAVAVAQMLFSVLAIHLTGGRIETHFHVFGSLAFLAFYRDRNVMLVATAVTGLSHLVGGTFWPDSVYADLDSSIAHTLEHIGWVVFENVFLIQLIRDSRAEVTATAIKQAELEQALAGTEIQVQQRTADLKRSQEQLTSQQLAMANSARNAALGEMAGQAAHEINTPLGALVLITQSLMERVDREPVDRAYFHTKLGLVMQITEKMSKIINSMRKLAGQGANEVVVRVKLRPLIDETVLLCEGRYKRGSIIFNIEYGQLDTDSFECRANEVSQVLINLLNNAHDAVKNQEDLTRRWVKLKVQLVGELVTFRIEDGGEGVAPEHRDKLFNSSFTTKSLDEGTGFGLPICKKIAERHHGRIYYDADSKTSCFVLELPCAQGDAMDSVVKVG